MNVFIRVILSGIMDLLETVVIALAFGVITYLFIFQPHEVIGSSMDGNAKIHEGQFILTDKISYRFINPERGTVVVFRYPLDNKYDYIKRIIALPNERIMLKDNKITIYNQGYPNGFELDESSYLASSVKTEARTFLKEGQVVQVPADKYIVLGDNREDSSDSRMWGFVSKEDIIGRSLFRYWPPEEIGFLNTPKY